MLNFCCQRGSSVIIRMTNKYILSQIFEEGSHQSAWDGMSYYWEVQRSCKAYYNISDPNTPKVLFCTRSQSKIEGEFRSLPYASEHHS